MGVGLGKNSPISLSLSKTNYEALLLRHGVWVRWRVATKCPCVLKSSMQPDIHCKKCGGTGITYGFQAQITVSETIMVTDDSGVIEISEEYSDCTLEAVYDYQGNKYDCAEKCGSFIALNACVIKGCWVYVVMLSPTIKTLDSAALIPLGNGYYRIPGIQSRRGGIDGLYHTAPSDIIAVAKITDSAGNEYKAAEYRLDTVLLEAKSTSDGGELIPVVEPVTAFDIEYIPPFIFAVLNQKLSKTDWVAMQQVDGDAIVVFPYSHTVAESDIITVLSGSYTQKNILVRSSKGDDTISAFFVSDIVSCVGNVREYDCGTDFLLTATNRLCWLCADAPEVGEAYSLTYSVLPTYVVAKSIAQIRVSENQRLPKKAVVKLFTSHKESRKANRQD